MAVSAVRGATVAAENSQQAIWDATEELLRALIERNRIEKDEVVAAFFTMTPDLDAAFPAYAARRLGWTDVPLLGAVETAVEAAPRRMIRILVEVERPQREKLQPVYLGETLSLRPDLAPPG